MRRSTSTTTVTAATTAPRTIALTTAPRTTVHPTADPATADTLVWPLAPPPALLVVFILIAMGTVTATRSTIGSTPEAGAAVMAAAATATKMDNEL
jgi:hypothetical protein